MAVERKFWSLFSFSVECRSEGRFFNYSNRIFAHLKLGIILWKKQKNHTVWFFCKKAQLIYCEKILGESTGIGVQMYFVHVQYNIMYNGHRIKRQKAATLSEILIPYTVVLFISWNVRYEHPTYIQRGK